MTLKKIKFCRRCDKKLKYAHLWYCDKCRRIRNKEIEKRHMQAIIRRQKEVNAKNNPFNGIRRRLINKFALKRTWDNNKNHRIAMRLRALLYGSLKSYTIDGKTMTSKKYGIAKGNKILSLPSVYAIT